MALIENRLTRSASAIAHTDCELAKLSRDDFEILLKKKPALALDILWGFVRTLSRRLRNSNDKVAFLAMSEYVRALKIRLSCALVMREVEPPSHTRRIAHEP